VNEVERWLSVEEIAGHLGVSKETVYRWLEKEDEKEKNSIPPNRPPLGSSRQVKLMRGCGTVS
jgi:transposase